MQGIHKEIQKLQASGVDKFILGARIAISEAEFQQCSQLIEQRVVSRWDEIGLERVKKMKKPLLGISRRERSLSLKGKGKDTSEGQSAPSSPPVISKQIINFNNEELERPMEESGGITSRGNPAGRVMKGAIRDRVADQKLEDGNENSSHGTAGGISEESEEEAYQSARAPITEGEGADELELQRVIEESIRLEEEKEASRKREKGKGPVSEEWGSAS
jgi:hypothetical protein